MPYSNIDKPSKYFNTILYTGDGTSGRTINVGFKPDFVWYKERVSVDYHTVFDAIRGATKRLFTNATEAEDTNAESLQSFVSNGYTIGNNSGTNGNGDTYVSWCWLGANTTASNTSGTITSTVSANTTSGFSIVSWTGNASNSTVGHSLGTTPSMIIVKNRSAVEAWTVYHSVLGNTKFLELSATDASQTSSTIWNNTSPTSTLFTVGTNSKVNGNTHSIIAYCFAEVKGFSKAFSYTGNGSTDGSFVYCGFRPAWILIKKSDGSVQNWVMHDSKRSPFNLSQNKLFANLSDAEDTGGTNYNLDILSNGFKLRSSNSDVNSSGGAYIGFAFAENPFVSSKGIPCTAR